MTIHNIEISVEETIKCIDRLEIDISETWGKLITGQITEAMNAIYDIFAKLDKLISCVNTINERLELKIDIKNIFNIFLQLENAMKIPDYVYMADLVEYEIKPVICIWRNQLLSKSILH